MSQQQAEPFIVGPVRFSYMNVFKPRESLDGDMCYSVVLLIPKAASEFNSDPKGTGKKVSDAIKGALGLKFPKAPDNWHNPLQDGDATGKHPGYWYVKAKAGEEYPPTLIDGHKEKAVASAWTSGDWGMVKLWPYAYDRSSKKGVGLILKAVQFLHKDEPFGSPSDPTDGFDVVEGAARPIASDEYDPFADE